MLEQISVKSLYECSPKQNLAIFLHQACFSPPISTWIEAIKKHLSENFPVLSVDIFKTYLRKSEHTVKGHMRKTFNNKISTKTSEKATTIPSEDPNENPK